MDQRFDHIMVIFPIQVISDPEDFSVILVYLKRDKLFMILPFHSLKARSPTALAAMYPHRDYPPYRFHIRACHRISPVCHLCTYTFHRTSCLCPLQKNIRISVNKVSNPETKAFLPYSGQYLGVSDTIRSPPGRSGKEHVFRFLL